MKEPKLELVGLMVCDYCLDGKGTECHTAGCIRVVYETARQGCLPFQGMTVFIEGREWYVRRVMLFEQKRANESYAHIQVGNGP